ncbi:MAG: GNAT family N-acetyltransferase [Xanthomonadales bacterium]|nr:GNAT family N-acetyltransferase [Xanthomonadales bacterium]
MEKTQRAHGRSVGDKDFVRVRRALPADLDDLIALENASFSSDRLSPRQWKHHLGSDRASILLVERQGRTGAAAVLFFRKGSPLARLYSLAVAAELRGRGIGEVLLEACEGEAAGCGCTQMRLEVRSDNLAAQRLYARRGYRLFASRPGYYEDGATALCYEKML